MKINHLELRNYRNYDELKLNFDSNLNIFIGNNAQGKTNLLESLYLLAFTKSHRTNLDAELIKFREKEAKIKAEIQKKSGSISLELILNNKQKRAKINFLEQKRLADYIGQLKVIIFAPEDLNLIKGSPYKRRRFLDMELSQLSPIYLYDLIQYQALLKQRNAFLKQIDNPKNFDSLLFQILTEQFCKFGAKIIEARLNFVDKLKNYADTFHQNIASQPEQLNLEYQSQFSLPLNLSIENIYDCFIEHCKKKEEKELYKKSSLLGPHRDDLVFLINNLNVANFGSQGQVKTASLSIKIAEIELIYQQINEYPILLLDDVMSELDSFRQKKLLENVLNKTQTFITTTTLDHLQELPGNLKIFTVKDGEIC
jgi:DNA replication and repair protein RecF